MLFDLFSRGPGPSTCLGGPGLLLVEVCPELFLLRRILPAIRKHKCSGPCSLRSGPETLKFVRGSGDPVLVIVPKLRQGWRKGTYWTERVAEDLNRTLCPDFCPDIRFISES